MRIRMSLPKVNPEKYCWPEECPHDDCCGQHFKLHQPRCSKQLLDPDEDQVKAKRFRCLRCKRTFRVYPEGVSRAHRSDRLEAIGVGVDALEQSVFCLLLFLIRTVSASSLREEVAQFTLSISINDTDGGSTTPSAGDHVYDEWTRVPLSAVPTDGWQFHGWDGPNAWECNLASCISRETPKLL